MSEHKIKFELPDIFNEALTPVASRASETLISLWDITFGGIDNYANRINFKRSIQLESFKDQLTKDINQIPKDNIVEPKLSIIGPAIESSKYYYEDSDIRNMFSKLISSSMDSAYQDIIRTSFTSIIKELEPIDASNLNILSQSVREPIVDIRFQSTSNDSMSTSIVTNLFLSNPSYEDHKLLSSSLINLERLGLIEIIKGSWLKEEAFYEPFLNNKLFKYYSSKEYIESVDDEYDQCMLHKGYVELTTFGFDFVKVCL